MKNLFLIAAFSLCWQALAHEVPGVTSTRDITLNNHEVELIITHAGLTLYTFDPDGADESTCYDGCAKNWPPLLLTPAQVALVSGSFHTTKRKDGSIQLSFDSRPLYLFIGDKKPGDTKGDGLGGVWHIAIDEDK